MLLVVRCVAAGLSQSSRYNVGCGLVVSCAGSPGNHNDAGPGLAGAAHQPDNQHNNTQQNILPQDNKPEHGCTRDGPDDHHGPGQLTILPVTAENLQKLDNAADINLSLPITSTYLRQMRHKSEMLEPEAVAINQADQEDEEVRMIPSKYCLGRPSQTLLPYFPNYAAINSIRF